MPLSTSERVSFIYPLYTPSSENPKSTDIVLVRQRVGETRFSHNAGGGDTIRHRKIGLTEALKEKVLHIDRLPPDVRKNVTYDVRTIIEKELEDLEWFFTEAPESFRRMRDRQIYYPFEAVMPADPKKARRTVEKLEEWERSLRFIKDAVLDLGLRYMRTGRI